MTQTFTILLDRVLLTALFGSLFALSLPSTADEKTDCVSARTTASINQCLEEEQKAVEARLEATYQELLQRLHEPDLEPAHNSTVRSQVEQAQQAWRTFREADCDAKYSLYGSGTIRTVAYLGCTIAHTEQRITQLENFIPY